MSDPEWLLIRYFSAVAALAVSLAYFLGAPSRPKAACHLCSIWIFVIAVPLATAAHIKRSSDLGFSVEYFRSATFSQRTGHACIEDFAAKDYRGTKPNWHLWWRRKFYSRWHGILQVPQNGQYDFFLEADDGARLLIDDQCVIDIWGNREWKGSGHHAELRLSTGPHPITIEHCKIGPTAAIRLKWCGGPIPPNTILGIPFVTHGPQHRTR
jgi:hypothetical protein